MAQTKLKEADIRNNVTMNDCFDDLETKKSEERVRVVRSGSTVTLWVGKRGINLSRATSMVVGDALTFLGRASDWDHYEFVLTDKYGTFRSTK